MHEITDEMVEAAITEYDGPEWRKVTLTRSAMRAALTAALALMPRGADVEVPKGADVVPRGADFRDGAEWAAGICSKRNFWNVSGETFAEDIRTALAALPEGGDGRKILTNDQIEALNEAADTIIDSADYLKDCLDEGREVYESKWLDGLMEVHGTLLGIVDAPPPAAPQTRDAGGGT